MGTWRTGHERLGQQEDGGGEGDSADADSHEGTSALETSSAALPSECVLALIGMRVVIRVGPGVAFKAPLPLPASPEPVARSRSPVKDC